MSNCFSLPHPHRHEPSPCFPTVVTPRQEEFGYSAPRKYRSATLESIQGFTSCCPGLAQSPPRGISPTRYFQPGYQATVPEHKSDFVRKDSYWTVFHLQPSPASDRKSPEPSSTSGPSTGNQITSLSECSSLLQCLPPLFFSPRTPRRRRMST